MATAPASKISLKDMSRMDGFRQPRPLLVVEEEDHSLLEECSPKALNFQTSDESFDDENKMQILEDCPVEKHPFVQREVVSSPALSCVNLLRQNNQNFQNFPIGKYGSTIAASKPLLIGGAKKRDAAGRCVSEALHKLSFLDSVDYDDSPVQKKKLAGETVRDAAPPVKVLPLVKMHPPVPLRAVNRSQKNGDNNQVPLLPLVRSAKHPDLKAISAQTLGDVLKKKIFETEIEQMWIVDCRYPFEYIAGHIQTAINCYHRESLTKHFLENPYQRRDPSKRHIVIFHCEFSSQRGPDLLRYLRSEDREINHKIYPTLSYPELYLLEGGYKAFFEACQDLCEPRLYTPMTADSHKDECSLYKAKAKSFHDFSIVGSSSRQRSKRF